MAETKNDWQEVKPLQKLTCSSHDCEHDLHCFRSKRPINRSYRNGRCVACNLDLIDWDRIDKKDLKDANYTVHAIQREMFRHEYWHKTIDEQALAHARKKGLQQLREDAEKRIAKYVGSPSNQNPWDGRQTPLQGNVIYYAQHATATCCRKCAEEWYGIDRNRPLATEEIKYMVDLIMLYVKTRVPDLPQ